MVIRVLLVMVAFAALYGCERGVEEAKEPTEQATMPTLFSASASASGDFFRFPEEQGQTGGEAVQAEVNCRAETYASKEDMSKQERMDFVRRVADLAAQEMMEDHSLSAGSALKKVLNDLGVPRYPECKRGNE
jgi:hypothetical protein